MQWSGRTHFLLAIVRRIVEVLLLSNQITHTFMHQLLKIVKSYAFFKQEFSCIHSPYKKFLHHQEHSRLYIWHTNRSWSESSFYKKQKFKFTGRHRSVIAMSSHKFKIPTEVGWKVTFLLYYILIFRPRLVGKLYFLKKNYIYFIDI